MIVDGRRRWVNIDVAERFASAHEAHDEAYRTSEVVFGFYGQESIDMDLHNNEVGRALTSHNSGASDSELEALVMEALNNGELSILSDSTLCTGSLDDGSVCTPCRLGEERHGT